MDPLNFAAWMDQNFGVGLEFGDNAAKMDFTRGFKSVNADFSEGDLAALHAGLGGLDALTTGITAGTTQTQVGATALTAKVNIIGTCANANDGVRLPLALAGRSVTVLNRGTNIARIYPGTSDTIDGGSANAAITIPVGGAYVFYSENDTNWKAQKTALQIDFGIGTLDGANPTPVPHRLNQIIGANVQHIASSAPGLDPHKMTYALSGNVLNVYAWKPTAADDCTLIASTNNTANFFWIAFGY